MKSKLFLIAAGFVLAFYQATFAADQTAKIAAGAKLTLTVASDGTAPISYQWFKDSQPIATGDTLAVDKLDVSNAGTYTVTATNDFGSATSDKFILVVGVTPSAPIIKTAFSNVSAAKQSTVTLGIAATGDALSYKWQKGNSLIKGEITPRFTIAKVTPADEGTYAVTVSNPYGAVTASAKLSVLR